MFYLKTNVVFTSLEGPIDTVMDLPGLAVTSTNMLFEFDASVDDFEDNLNDMAKIVTQQGQSEFGAELNVGKMVFDSEASVNEFVADGNGVLLNENEIILVSLSDPESIAKLRDNGFFVPTEQ